MTIIIAFIGIIFLVLGFAFLIKGYNESPASDKIASKEEYEAIKGNLATAKEQEKKLKLQLDSMAVVLEESQRKAEKLQIVEGDMRSLQLQEQEYQQKIVQLEDDLKFMTQKADSQAQESLTAIEMLTADNASLKTDLELSKAMTQKESSEQVANIQLMIDRVQQENDTLKEGIQRIVAKIGEVEKEYENAKSNYTAQLAETRQAMAVLTTEHQELKEKSTSATQDIETEESEKKVHQENETRLNEALSQIVQLQNQIGALNDQVVAGNNKIKELEDNLVTRREEKVHDQDMIQELKQQVSRSQAVVTQVDTSSADEMRNAWEQEKQELEANLTRLQELNEYLIEKEKKLQLELTKARTQSLGWQKVYQEFKAQVEKNNPGVKGDA